jgi:hypothetical protein
MREWSDSLNDPDIAPVFWLALAATQWRCGRLESHALMHALKVIDDESDLCRWESDPKQLKRRQAVLNALRAQVSSPQPGEKRIQKRFRDTNEWKVGDLIAYRMQSRHFVILRIIGHHSDKGGTAPICELLEWSGEQIPQSLKHLGTRKGRGVRPVTQFMIGRTQAKERPDDRLQDLGINTTPTQQPAGFRVLLWRSFDKTLEQEFGLK